MSVDERRHHETLLDSYIIAREELRFNEQTARHGHPSRNQQGERVICGFIPGCGESCDTAFHQILLEVVLNSARRIDPKMEKESMELFAGRLAKLPASWIEHTQEVALPAPAKHLPFALTCAPRSLGLNHTADGDQTRNTTRKAWPALLRAPAHRQHRSRLGIDPPCNTCTRSVTTEHRVCADQSIFRREENL